MENLTREQLIELLGNGASNKKQSRKKTILDEEKREAMLLKLENMRKIAENNRIKKKEAAQKETAPAPINVVFEKQYSTQLEKMTDLLHDLNENTKELSKLKKEKLKKREEDLAIKNAPVKEPAIKEPAIKEIPAVKEMPVIKEATVSTTPQNKPLEVQEKPSKFIPMYESKQIPSQADLLNPPKIKPNRNMFRKNQIW